MKLVVAEKPSVAQSLAAVLGAKQKKQGYLEGGGFLVSWCVGHLVGLAPADAYDPKYSEWTYEDLPIIPKEWQFTVDPGKKEQFKVLSDLMSRADVDSLVCATDAGREGELIFRLVYQQAGCRKPMERLWISSMEEDAIKAGFSALRPSSEYDLLYEGVIFTDGATEVVYYNQLDERWADLPYGTDNIGGYGCGPTSMAIVVSSLTDQTVDPPTMAEWAYQNGYWCSGNGSYHSLIPGAAEGFGLQWESISTDDPQAVVDALASGKLIVALMSKGHFTSSGHFMVLRGVTSEGKILVADPASKKRSEQEWDISIILDEARKGAAAGGPLWAIY